MSGNDRPEQRAFAELETLVRHLGEELAAFRRRALLAESQLRDAGQAPSPKGKGPLADRLAELETENESLRTRVTRAEERVRQMMDRLRFLRQQLQLQSPASTGSGR
jgi:predicted  nucleic acid-binding Zn-ribbon protein